MRRATWAPADTFYHVAEVAWDYLSPGTKQAVRHTSARGRTLFDSRVTDLIVRLGHRKHDRADGRLPADEGDWDSSDTAVAAKPPTPAELRATLAAILHRGARLRVLRLRFLKDEAGHRPVHEREAQLLAVLGTVSGCSVQDLRLSGGVPLSGAVASAVAGALPCLTHLGLDYEGRENDLPQGQRDGEAASEYYYGAIQLLTLCGPRLRELHLCGGVQQWPMVAFQALGLCTALTLLKLEAGPKVVNISHGKRAYLGSPVQEATLVSAIAQLTSLRSLSLKAIITPAACQPAALALHATSLARLSALAALIHLQLTLSPCYEDHGDAWSRQDEDGEHHAAWVEVREVHRATLLSALQAMPQLQHLYCPTLWLRPSEAATLTALTSLTLGGLYPPPAGEGSGSGGAMPLPPQLIKLALHTAASPRVLAGLQFPDTLEVLNIWQLRFGMSDVTPDHQLLPETVAAMGPAVRRISGLRGPRPGYAAMMVAADAAPGLLAPRSAVPDGHAEWLGSLRGFVGMSSLVMTMNGLALDFGDVCCLASALCKYQCLSILGVSYPLTALPALLGMEALVELDLDLSLATGVTASTLEAALLTLCGQARSLRRVVCTNCPLTDHQGVQNAVLDELRSRGKDGVELMITGG